MRKLDQKRGLVFAAGGALGLATIGLAIRPVLAQQAPTLKLAQISSNQFQLTLSNTVAGETYVIYRRQALWNVCDPWQPDVIGSPNQTVFTVLKGIEDYAFFVSISGTNWDGDGANNWIDANPVDPTVGVLSVTIESPANGSNIQ